MNYEPKIDEKLLANQVTEGVGGGRNQRRPTRNRGNMEPDLPGLIVAPR